MTGSAIEQGWPKATTCRWCGDVKYMRNGCLICRTCDGPIHLLKVKPPT